MLDSIKRSIARLDQMPLVSLEQHLWKRRLAPVMGWRRWINLFVSWSVLTASVILYLTELVRALRGGEMIVVPPNMRWLMGVYAILAFIFYAAPWARANTLAQKMINRDKSKTHNWELIVLTGVDARSYVMAKWWAIVRALFPALLPTAIVRAGAVTFLVAEISRWYVDYAISFYGRDIITIIPPSAFDILMVGVLSFVLTYAGLPSSTASSLFNALNSRGNGSTWAQSFMNRIGGSMSMAALWVGMLILTLGLSGILSQIFPATIVHYTLALTFFTLLDNGFVLTAVIAAYVYFRQSVLIDPLGAMSSLHAGLIVLLTLPCYSFITMLLLTFAEWTAEQSELIPADAATIEKLPDAA